MKADELCFLPVTELAPLLRTRQVSPVEVTRAALDRIEKVDGRLNCYLTVLREAALAAAAVAEKEIQAGNYRGPLHGVPISLKDLYATRGVRTTAGSKVLADWVPDYDATTTERLAQAGTILLGKTNMHEIAFGITNNNPHYGPTRNPWNPECIPGGSSGGTGAALAAGLCFASLGTDTGGSIRIPAALCGIVGLKPTYGRVSRFGVVPLSWSLDHAGPMARTVADTALVLQAIAGPDPRDPSGADLPVPDYLAALTGEIKGLRIGVPAEHFFTGLDEEVLGAVKAAIGLLEKLGAQVEEVSLPHIRYAASAVTTTIMCEAASYHEPSLRSRPQDFGEETRIRLETGRLLPATDYLRAQRVRSLFREDCRRALQGVDLIVTPTIPITAPRIGDNEVDVGGQKREVRATVTRFTNPFNLAGLPTISVPCGFSTAGLPIGLQLVGRPFAEETVLRAAQAYEAQVDWIKRRPAL